MFKLSRIVKNYKETGALNENVSVYGFLDDQVSLSAALAHLKSASSSWDSDWKISSERDPRRGWKRV